jgi:hypothetical protein
MQDRCVYGVLLILKATLGNASQRLFTLSQSGADTTFGRADDASRLWRRLMQTKRNRRLAVLSAGARNLTNGHSECCKRARVPGAQTCQTAVAGKPKWNRDHQMIAALATLG